MTCGRLRRLVLAPALATVGSVALPAIAPPAPSHWGAGLAAQIPAGRPVDSATAAVVDSLVALGRLQEAAWAARAAGDTARGEALLSRLETILRRPPESARPLAMDSQGVSYTFRLDHGDGVHSIFKVDGSDIFCPACGADREVAAYRVDRLLGFDLTPMTVPHRIVHEGDTLNGSAMYFVNGARSPDPEMRKPPSLRLFDAIIGNSDRHSGNWLMVGDRAVAIDHNRAFEYHPATRPKSCWETELDAVRLDIRLRRPFRRYRTLPDDSLAAAVAVLDDAELRTEFVRMRDRVVDRMEQRLDNPERPLRLTDCAFPSEPFRP